MKTITARNVNEAFPLAMMLIEGGGVYGQSRNGPVIEVPEPVGVTYLMPEERVMFSPDRDCNPFFHLFESLWIINGNRDVGFLTQFNKRMAEYSDDGETFNAAYGYRMRYEQGFDQLQYVIDMLKKDPSTRHGVIQLWDANKDLKSSSKDKACNDLIMFKIREGFLDMTVMNRSNDLIWGMMGANVVHFSMIQEYVADKVGVAIGKYNQITDSMHVYTDNPQYEKLRNAAIGYYHDYYSELTVKPYPIKAGSDDWDKDLKTFINDPFGDNLFFTPFFDEVVQPMAIAWQAHKAGDSRDALEAVVQMVDCDWKVAGQQWLMRRAK